MARPPPRWAHRLVLALLYLMTTSFYVAFSSDSDVLLSFKANISDPRGALQNWISGINPCFKNHANWTGVICNEGYILGLQLENMSLSGSLKLDALAVLPGLRTLSFMNNSFDGPLPDVAALGALRSIYLSGNKFSGEIDDEVFTGMGALRKVYLSQNKFSGAIPTSLAGLPKLVELRLDDNSFSGQIPDLQQEGLTLVNVSYNDLEGAIPASLSKMNVSLFAGNKDLCGLPLRVSCSKAKKLSTLILILIVLIVIVVIVAAAALILGVLRRKGHTNKGHTEHPTSPKVESYNEDKLEQGSSGRRGSQSKAGPKQEVEQRELVFVRDDRARFELQDLLSASAEVLGSGSFGSSYKAVLPQGPALVVKRFKEMNEVGKEDFQEHMNRLGMLSHPNLLPVVAYYYRREEKLLVIDYIPSGSLANLLHGNSDSKSPMLDWPTRLKIVKGVARGLSYLYDALPMLNIPHGDLKSSNVLLDNSFEPLLTDYSLIPIMNQARAARDMVAYKSPEYTQYGRTSNKSDVWSFGILILEALTGKFPTNYLRQGRGGTDLASWVNSVVREEWTGEVFDTTMKGTRNGEGEMLKLLQIGLGCCEVNVEKRMDMRQALEEIEELKERENEEESSYVSEGEVYSSRGVTDDDFSFSTNN